MKKIQSLLLVLSFFIGASACAKDDDLPPIQILLVGDSTLAPHNGFGDEFCKKLIPKVTCTNLAKNGRSSGSYRAEGSWDKVREILSKTAQQIPTYVLVEFGHNDQPGKPGRSTDLKTEFPVNLENYVLDIRSLGGKPILSTPLSRRAFNNDQLVRDLDEWALVTKEIALKNQVPLIDLLTVSADAVQSMGSKEADSLAVEPPGGALHAFDHTHVGPKGAKYFANLVLPLYKKSIPELIPYFVSESGKDQ